MDFYDWPQETLLLVRGHDAAVAFAVVRLLIVGLVGSISLSVIMYHHSKEGDARAPARDFAAIFACGGIASFELHFLLAFAVLKRWVEIPEGFMQPLRAL